MAFPATDTDAAAIAVALVCMDAQTGAREFDLRLPPGSCVADALRAAGLAPDSAGDRVGIWGKRCGLTRLLVERDRVEVYAPLLADPKQARRQRFAKQGVRRAGLFAKRRAGGKPGY